MSLPSYLKSNESGQVLVIFLLVLVIGLALVLSIASRTVTDIRQTTTSDESNRAYFAAESGVEDALKKIEDNPAFASTDTNGDGIPDPYPLNFTAVNNTNSDVLVTSLSAPANTILDFLDYRKDDVAQISLMSNFNVLATAGVGASIVPGDTIILHYGKDGTNPLAANAPAIEVSFVVYSGGTWGIKKMTFDPNTRSNGFCKPGVGSAATSPSGKKYQFSVQIQLNNPPCNGNNEPVIPNPVIARVRFLYGDSPLGVEVTTKALPQQGQKITSTGETPSGVSRKLEVSRFYPTLPAIFDYVLYNGSSGDLCKGSCP